MKKIYVLALMMVMGGAIYAETTAFDSMDKAVEVKLQPAIKTQNTLASNKTTTTTTTAPVVKSSNIQVQKYNSALVSLDDAQVELRQELATVTDKYNVAVQEREKAIQNCKSLKKEIKEINKKMKNVDRSKKMINANLENAG